MSTFESPVSATSGLQGYDLEGATGVDISRHRKVPKDVAGYTTKTALDTRCRDCVMFVSPDACTKVKGSISPDARCRFFSAKTAKKSAKRTLYIKRPIRNGDEIGSHGIAFAPTATGFEVDVAIDIVVKMAFVTVYRYNQEGHDVWRDGRLVEARYRTDDNGTATTLAAVAEAGQLLVEGARGRLLLPAGSMTDLGFWNEGIIEAPMVVDSQTGEAGKLQAGQGVAEAVTVRGRRLAATRYAITSTKGRSGSVWYAADGQWVKAQIITRGNTLDYELA